jgi:ferric-dicitrate binding protein FerR (iron transport regulator)
MEEKQLTSLIEKYLSGEATETEKALVEKWYENLESSAGKLKLEETRDIDASEKRSLVELQGKIQLRKRLAEVSTREAHTSMLSGRTRIWLAAAVVALLVASATLLVFNHSPTSERLTVTGQLTQADVPPGGNKAVLTLSNGATITLDSLQNGLVSVQGKTRIVKQNSGQLAYQTAGIDPKKPLYNTITTPRGGYFEVVLPDGSHVWLNAASSIRFPAAFPDGAREVQVTGEAYFEIARKSDRPFRVRVNKMTITVLGTHFDVMAYQDETAIRTTLVEGSVRITQGDAAMTLTAGQQLSLNQMGDMKLMTSAEINKVIAWKNHLFWFENDDIQTIMRQLARWYNVAVEIKGTIPGHFTGSLPRNVPVSKVFEVLQQTGSIHYKIEPGRIIVSS